MLKHPVQTASRIKQFTEFLATQIITSTCPLTIEFCPEAHASESAARTEGPWEPVEKGFQYGPAYRTVWFRVTGKVPKEMAGQSVGMRVDVGGERTIWRDDVPWQGLDDPHPICPLFDAARTGQKVEFCIQAYTRNPQCRVHKRELPREELVETVQGAELVAINEELKALHFDMEFAYNLLDALETGDPSYHILLRALNDVCNVFSRNGNAVPRCRKIVREALLNLSGDIPHAIYPLGHAHLDTAWLWPIEITMKKMAHTAANQLRLMEKYPEYIYVHSQASQYEWMEKQYPKLFDRIKKAVAAGQWEPVGSMWVEADCNLTGGESLVRQFLYGRRYFREKLRTTTDDMFLPDVFGYSAALPQILNKFGIKYFLTQKISWNQTNKFPHNTFFWQGIDGSKIWSHFPPADTYIGVCEPKEMLRSVKNHRDHARSDSSLYLFGWGDGGGGPTERHIEFLRRARATSNLPEILSGKKAIDFYRDSATKSRDLAVWSGELYFEYHRGTYTSQARNKRHNRECEFLLRDAEWLCCFRDDFPKGYPRKELEAAWKLVLLNQFHDIIPGSSVNEVYVDSEKDYEAVHEVGNRIVNDSIARMASYVDSEGMQRPHAIFHNAHVPNFGRIPWTADEVPASIVCGDESLPVQCVESFGQRELLFLTPTDALGSVAVAEFSDSPAQAKFRLKASNRRLENAFFSVRFDAHGNITSIQSLEDGTEFVLPGKLANLFQLFEDKPLFWSAWDIDQFAYETGINLLRSERFEVVERGPLRVAVEIEKRFGKSRIIQRIAVGPQPTIHFETEVDWHEEDKLLKVAFPVNVNTTRSNCEIQFGNVERPTHQNTSWDQAKFEVCAQKWVDLSEGDHGMALLNQGKYGHDIVGSTMRLSLLRSPKAPDPECDIGTHRFSYALMPHFGPYNYAGVVPYAYGFNAKVHAVPIEARGGEFLSLPQFVVCDDRNLVIEAVKRAEDSNAVIVRIYECHNSRGQAELQCARPIKSAALCDLEERVIQQLDVVEGLVVLPYLPFEILTIRLEV